MHRKFIALIATLAIFVTAISADRARANDDAIRTLATIAGLAIIGKVVHDQIQQNGGVTRNADILPDYDRFDSDLVIEPRPLPRRVRRNLLPGDCLRFVETRRGDVRIFSERCLRRNYEYTGRLPRDCRVRLRGDDDDDDDDGIRRGYELRCLRDRGYQLARW